MQNARNSLCQWTIFMRKQWTVLLNAKKIYIYIYIYMNAVSIFEYIVNMVGRV